MANLSALSGDAKWNFCCCISRELWLAVKQNPMEPFVASPDFSVLSKMENNGFFATFLPACPAHERK